MVSEYLEVPVMSPRVPQTKPHSSLLGHISGSVCPLYVGSHPKARTKFYRP